MACGPSSTFHRVCRWTGRRGQQPGRPGVLDRAVPGHHQLLGASFSHDNERVLVSHDATGVFNAYWIPVTGGEPTALTQSDTDAIFALSWFPEDDRFFYTADQGGNELNHVYVQLPDGETVDLTPGDGLKAQFGGWNHDRTAFFISTNERDNRFFDLYQYSAADDYPRELIYQNTEGYFPGPVSADGRYVALTLPRTTNDNDLYVYDRETEELTHLTPHEGNMTSAASDFSRIRITCSSRLTRDPSSPLCGDTTWRRVKRKR